MPVNGYRVAEITAVIGRMERFTERAGNSDSSNGSAGATFYTMQDWEKDDIRRIANPLINALRFNA
jgi:hypothetical protein